MRTLRALFHQGHELGVRRLQKYASKSSGWTRHTHAFTLPASEVHAGMASSAPATAT